MTAPPQPVSALEGAPLLPGPLPAVPEPPASTTALEAVVVNHTAQHTSEIGDRGSAILALARRVAVTVVGAALVTVGLVLLILPGPGLLLVLAGLVVLATEYPWARRCTEPVRRQATAAARASVASRLRIAWTAAVGLALIGAGAAWIAVPSLPLAGIATGSGLILSGVVLVALLIHSVLAFGSEQRAYPFA
jgi:uncharacterized protein (TIGR02611 family)